MASAAEQRRALITALDMLSLQCYAPRLVAAADCTVTSPTETDVTGSTKFHGFRSIDELRDAPPELWKSIVTKRHHQAILEGYLSVRTKGGDTAEAAAAERRFQCFQTIKQVLSDLRELNLQKALLDQKQHGLLVGKGPKKSTTAVEGESEADAMQRVRDDILDVVTRIDDAKERLQMAQDLIGFKTQPSRGVGITRLSSSRKPTTTTTGEGPTNARKAAPPAPNMNGDATTTTAYETPRFADDDETANDSTRDAETPRKSAAGDATAESRPNVVNPGSHRRPKKPSQGTWSRVDFEGATDAAKHRHEVTKEAVGFNAASEPSPFYAATSIGHGWDRNFPSSKFAHMEHQRMQAAIARRNFSRYAERRREEQLEKDVAAALAAAEAQQTAPAPFVVTPVSLAKPPPTKLDDRRPKSAGRQVGTTKGPRPSTARPDVTVAPQVRIATDAQNRYYVGKMLSINGIAADTVTLGMDLPTAHSAQMKCGALLRTTLEAAKRAEAYAGSAQPEARPSGLTQPSAPGRKAAVPRGAANRE